LCNRATETVDVEDAPFVTTLCLPCGFVHGIVEQPRGAPADRPLDRKRASA
jgi:hypothetical protein